jgi:hypothetical protein
MTYTLDGLSSMGTVNKEESVKDANLFFTAMPGSDSANAIQLDIFGATRTITVSGIYASTDGTISTFVAALDALVNGAQTATKTFHSDKSGVSYEVLVTSVTWTCEEGGVNKVEYTIVMQEGST